MIPRRRIQFELEDFLDALRTLWTPASLAGRLVSAFETEFASFVGVDHAIAVASGRDALGLILDALGLAPGDEVIVPAYTLGELLPLLTTRNLVPVPADIERATLNVNAASLALRIGPRTRAILVVHLLGAPCAMREIIALGDAHGIPVIEDCAHAVGAAVDAQPVGSFGRAALFSLESTKAVSSFGGGVVATRDAGMAEAIRNLVAARRRREWPAIRKMLLKSIEELVVRSPAYAVLARLLFSERRAGGFERFYRGAHDRVRGVPAGFGAFQARLARRRLQRVESRNRMLNAAWQEMARRLPEGFGVQRRDAAGQPSFYNLVALFDGDVRRLRTAAQRLGLDLGIGGEVMDDTAALLGRDDCPEAARASAHAVLVPLHAGMDEHRRRRVLDRLAAAAGAAR